MEMQIKVNSHEVERNNDNIKMINATRTTCNCIKMKIIKRSTLSGVLNILISGKYMLCESSTGVLNSV